MSDHAEPDHAEDDRRSEVRLNEHEECRRGGDRHRDEETREATFMFSSLSEKNLASMITVATFAISDGCTCVPRIDDPSARTVCAGADDEDEQQRGDRHRVQGQAQRTERSIVEARQAEHERSPTAAKTIWRDTGCESACTGDPYVVRLPL